MIEGFELAAQIHGHESPGVALAVRMAELAYEHLGTTHRGRGITGVAETSICVPDGLQAVAGTTPGLQNLIVHDMGKLALTVADFKTRTGYRVALKKKAAEISPAVHKFMYRTERLEKDEKAGLVPVFLNLDPDYFKVTKVRLTIPLNSERTPIAECQRCGELQPEGFMEDGLCMTCTGRGYWESAD